LCSAQTGGGGCENGKWTDLVAVGNFEDDKVTALAGWMLISDKPKVPGRRELLEKMAIQRSAARREGIPGRRVVRSEDGQRETRSEFTVLFFSLDCFP
jgi:hypothetical protein